eukprot:748639-Hanusia_phi.AAC.1
MVAAGRGSTAWLMCAWALTCSWSTRTASAFCLRAHHSLLRPRAGVSNVCRARVSSGFGAVSVVSRRERTGARWLASAVEMSKKTAIITNENHRRHNGFMHPECPQRVDLMWEQMHKQGIVDSCNILENRLAEENELGLVHDKDYVDSIVSGNVQLDGSTYFHKKDSVSANAARAAAGAVIDAVEAVCKGEVNNSFCAVRPPGHHAERDRMMGFCIFNSVAIAAEKAKKEWGCKKVLIFDWDVHHGNGIQNIFYDDPNVLYISIHRGGMDKSFFYPTTGTADETGSGEGRGYNVNIPLEFPGIGDPVYASAMERVVLPISHAFKPDIVIVSAGFDAAGGDPLGGMNVSPAMFRRMTGQMMEVANEHCNGKIVLALEVKFPVKLLCDVLRSLQSESQGGYDVDVTAECAVECLKELAGLGEKMEEEETEAMSPWAAAELAWLQPSLDRIVQIQSEFWPQLKAASAK